MLSTVAWLDLPSDGQPIVQVLVAVPARTNAHQELTHPGQTGISSPNNRKSLLRLRHPIFAVMEGADGPCDRIRHRDH